MQNVLRVLPECPTLPDLFKATLGARSNGKREGGPGLLPSVWFFKGCTSAGWDGVGGDFRSGGRSSIGISDSCAVNLRKGGKNLSSLTK